MNVQTLPLPNPGDWVTVDGAARLLGKSKKQVIRYLADQKIRGYRFYGASDRLAERMMWRPDVEEFRLAQIRVGRPGVVEQVRRRAVAAGEADRVRTAAGGAA